MTRIWKNFIEWHIVHAWHSFLSSVFSVGNRMTRKASNIPWRMAIVLNPSKKTFCYLETYRSIFQFIYLYIYLSQKRLAYLSIKQLNLLVSYLSVVLVICQQCIYLHHDENDCGTLTAYKPWPDSSTTSKSSRFWTKRLNRQYPISDTVLLILWYIRR